MSLTVHVDHYCMLLDYGAKRHAGMEPPGSKASGNQAAWTINSSCWLDATLTPDSMVTVLAPLNS